MGLKCSVLGHAYGETTVERDREERGSEVVITIRELETCDRCGDTRIVTENKEVTTIETPDDRPDVTAEDAMAAMEAENHEAATATDQTADDPPTDESLVDDAEGGVAVTEDSVSSPTPDVVEDQGAEILDDEAAATEEAAVDDELADPSIEDDADIPGASSEDEDAVILDDEPTPPSETSTGTPDEGSEDEPAEDGTDSTTAGPFDPPEDESTDDNPLGEWPEETLRDTDDDDWTPTEDLTGTVDDVDPDADVDRTFSTNSAVTVPEGEFFCDNCGYQTPVEASSLRAGDYCPECRESALVHRPEE